MPFEKGKSGNPNGRKKGQINKTTREMKESFQIVMDLLEKRMTSTDTNGVIQQLSPARAAELYANLLKFTKPTLSSIKQDNTHQGDITIRIIDETDGTDN